MSRNYAASENPHPRKWRPAPRYAPNGDRSDPDHGWSADRVSRGSQSEIPVYLTDGTYYFPLRQLPLRFQLAIEECVEKFIRQHPTPKGI